MIALAFICCGSAAAAPPANDNFTSAVQLTGNSVTTTGTTVEATSTAFQADENYFGDVGTAGSVWYQWTAPAGVTRVRVTVVFNGEAGECIVRRTDSPQYVGGMAQYLSDVRDASWRSFIVSTVPGEIYRIRVADQYAGHSGSFTLSLSANPSAPPANDTKATATVLPSQQNVTMSGSFQNATCDAVESQFPTETSSKYINTPAAVWYRWTAPASGKYGVNVIGQKYLRAQVVSFSNSLIPVVDTNRGPNGFDATAGQQYFIKVISDVGGDFFSGNFNLILARTPYADQRTYEDPPRPLEQSLNYQLAGSTPSNDGPLSGPAYAPLLPNVYCFLTTYPVAPLLTAGTWEIGGYDPAIMRVTVFRDANGVFSPVATSDTFATTRFVAVGNTGYYAEVALAHPENALSTAALGGKLTLKQVSASSTPPNDTFANATVLTSQPLTSVKGTTNGASGEVLEDFSERDEAVTRDIASRSVWYRWTPLTTATHYIIALDDENKPMHVRITQGSLGALGNYGSDETLRTTGVVVSSSDTYNICVDDETGSATGNFRLFIGRNLSFDNFATPQLLTANGAGVASWRYGCSLGLTRELEPDVSNIAHTAWFEFRTNSATPLYINTFGSTYDTVLHVYTGSALNALTLVADNDDFDGGLNRSSALSFTPVASTSYKIRVSGYGTASGIFALQIGVQPTSWTPYEVWAQNYDWSSPDRNQLADPDHDGLTNLEECAFGGHPLIRESDRSPAGIFGQDSMPPQLLVPPNYGISYRVFSKNLIGQGIGPVMTVTPQVSGHLQSWLVPISTVTDGITTVTVSPPSQPTNRIFLRTKVTQ